MILSGKQLKEQQIITNIENPKCVQQVGIDLEIIKIDSVEDRGFIFKDKTVLPKYYEIKTNFRVGGGAGWMLKPGYYQIWFKQGCKIPSNIMFRLRQRSSLLRSGIQIHSSVFDPGFETDQMGTFMIVHRETWVQQGARVCQAYADETTTILEDDLYKGQYQKDQ